MGTTQCVFCGGSGKLTKEHVFPQWASQLAEVAPALLRRGPTVPATPVNVARRNADGDWVEASELRSQHAAGLQAVTVRKVCATCNNGWLSSLEGKVKPLLEDMIRGPVTVGAEQQETLATWAVKTSLTYGLYQPQTNGYGASAYRELYETRRPISGARVHVGRCPSAVALAYSDGRKVGRPGASVESIMGSEPAVNSATIGIGGVLLVVTYFNPRSDLGARDRRALDGRRLDRARRVRRIWPVSRSIRWPQPDLDEASARGLILAQYRALESRPSVAVPKDADGS